MAYHGNPNFGKEMAARRAALGIKGTGGRKPMLEKHAPDARKVEQIFATAMPNEARKYVRELDVKDPETCPRHSEVLECPEPECHFTSQRTFYNHKAAQYMFDRIMGKPTSRSEIAITVRLVEQIVMGVVMIFGEVNGIPDADDRREAFAIRCRELGTHFSGQPTRPGEEWLEAESA